MLSRTELLLLSALLLTSSCAGCPLFAAAGTGLVDAGAGADGGVKEENWLRTFPGALGVEGPVVVGDDLGVVVTAQDGALDGVSGSGFFIERLRGDQAPVWVKLISSDAGVVSTNDDLVFEPATIAAVEGGVVIAASAFQATTVHVDDVSLRVDPQQTLYIHLDANGDLVGAAAIDKGGPIIAVAELPGGGFASSTILFQSAQVVLRRHDTTGALLTESVMPFGANNVLSQALVALPNGLIVLTIPSGTRFSDVSVPTPAGSFVLPSTASSDAQSLVFAFDDNDDVVWALGIANDPIAAVGDGYIETSSLDGDTAIACGSFAHQGRVIDLVSGDTLFETDQNNVHPIALTIGGDGRLLSAESMGASINGTFFTCAADAEHALFALFQSPDVAGVAGELSVARVSSGAISDPFVSGEGGVAKLVVHDDAIFLRAFAFGGADASRYVRNATITGDPSVLHPFLMRIARSDLGL